MDNASAASHSSPEAAAAAAAAAAARTRPRKLPRVDRPCDICRKRKLKCVKEPQQDKCVLCSFHQRECTYLDEPQRRKKRRAGAEDTEGSVHDGETTLEKRTREARDEGSTSQASHAAGRSLLDRTLGLHRTTHSKYVGPGSPHEGVLLDLAEATKPAGEESRFRRVAESTTFITQPDRRTLFSSDDDDDIEAIEQLVVPHGPGLVDLYFRTVHPSYPILHKGVFLEKYDRSFREFSPPLLAAVYLLAMDWWDYDRDLSTKEKPGGDALVRAATKALTAVVHRPKLSTIQAGLLLLQRHGGDSWVLTSQVVAVAEELGLHVDCSAWNIPDWERGLRRRLAWAVFMQDKWGSLIHGRPSHVLAPDWRMPHLSLADFPESARDQDDKEGSTEVETGRLLFIHLARLTEIMAEALETLYSGDQTANRQLLARSGVQGLLALVKPIAVKLKAWAGGMPVGLRMEDVRTRRLCSNGYLHLAYYVTEILVYRFVVRVLAPDSPPRMRHLCREAACARLEHAVRFVEALRPEHLQAFWWFASAKSLVYIRTYGGLLWATSATDREADFYRQKLDEFRWSLKVRAKSAGFVCAALREMEDSLEDPDMSRSPVGRVAIQPAYGAMTTAGNRDNDDNEGLLVPPRGLGMSVPATGESYGQADPQDALLMPDFTMADFDAMNSQVFLSGDMGSQNLFFSGPLLS